MTPQDRKFLQTVYAKAERKKRLRAQWLNIALGALGMAALAVACAIASDDMMRYGLISALALSLICAADWVWQGVQLENRTGDGS